MTMSVDVARENRSHYGDYPYAITFANNDNMADHPELTEPAYSAAFDPDDSIKRHAACDECRMPLKIPPLSTGSDLFQVSAN